MKGITSQARFEIDGQRRAKLTKFAFWGRTDKTGGS